MLKIAKKFNIKEEELVRIDILVQQLASTFIEGLHKATAPMTPMHRDIVLQALLVRLNASFLPILAESDKTELEPFIENFVETIKETIEWTKNKKQERLEAAKS